MVILPGQWVSLGRNDKDLLFLDMDSQSMYSHSCQKQLTRSDLLSVHGLSCLAADLQRSQQPTLLYLYLIGLQHIALSMVHATPILDS